jgi:hypothetical protein
VSMKWITYLFVISAFMFSVSVFAKDTNSGSFDLTNTARIGSTQLAPGHYKAEWTGPANDLRISILKGKETVATVEGHIKELASRAPYSAVVLNEHTNRVDEIDFGNRTEALQLAE